MTEANTLIQILSYCNILGGEGAGFEVEGTYGFGVVLGWTLKYRNSNLLNLQKLNLEPTEPLICSWNRTSNLPNLLKTEPNLEPY